jgi:hypothetical protein
MNRNHNRGRRKISYGGQPNVAVRIAIISLLLWTYDRDVTSFQYVQQSYSFSHRPLKVTIDDPRMGTTLRYKNNNIINLSRKSRKAQSDAHQRTRLLLIPPSRSTLSLSSSCLFLSSGNNNNNNKKNLSSAERERRDEESRRQQRKDDVVINKTSAKRGAKDYALDPKATEEEYLRQATRVEQTIYRLTEEGMEAIKSLKLQDADRAFDEVFQLKPTAYLWQAGIVKFYLGDLVGAAHIFVRNAVLYETKFGSPASEERIWRDACELKYLNSLPRKKQKELLAQDGGIKSIIPQISTHKVKDDTGGGLDTDFTSFGIETRKVIKLTRDLFAAAVESDRSTLLLAQAQLRSIGGPFEEVALGGDKKMRRLNSWFYLGLYSDVMGDREDSKKSMKMALQLSPSMGKSSDIVQTLPILHMTVRDWFDDDEFENNPMLCVNDDNEDDSDQIEDCIVGGSGNNSSFNSQQKSKIQQTYSDPVVEASILEGVGKMKFVELKEALRIRGLKTTGSKETLQERLFCSLMDDAGFQSGFAP